MERHASGAGTATEAKVSEDNTRPDAHLRLAGGMEEAYVHCYGHGDQFVGLLRGCGHGYSRVYRQHRRSSFPGSGDVGAT